MRFLPLLALVFLASAAVTSPERTVAEARKAIDRADLGRAEALIAEGLRTANQDSETFQTLRVMRAEVLLVQSKFREVRKELEAEFPPRHRHSAAAIQRLLYLAFATHELTKDAARERQYLATAESLATQYQPAMLPGVYRAKTQLSGKIADAQKTLELAQKYGDRRVEVKALATLVQIYTAGEDFVAAIDAGERAVRLATELGLVNVAQNAQGNLAWSYFELGDYDRAAELWTKAEATTARTGNSLNQSAWLINLGNIQFRKGAYAAAERYNQQALQVATRELDRGYALANLANAAIEQRQFDKASELNTRARRAKQAAGDKDALLGSDIVDARILTARDGNHGRAEKLLQEVAGQKSTHRLEAQTELAKLYVRWKPERAERAFEEAVASARRQRGEITDRELRLSFFNTVEDLYDAYVDFLAGRSDRALEVAEESRAESLEENRVKAVSRRFDPKEIAREHGATILSYWLGRERSFLWVITATETKLHELPRAGAIEGSIDRFQRVVRQGSPTDDGMRLYGMLVGKARVAPGSRVIVVPDGRLHLLNFEMLQPAANRYWIEDVIITNAASLRLLMAKPRKRSAPETASLLLVGNAPSPDPIAYPLLKFAAGEMQAIGSRFRKKTVLEGVKATPAAYRAASPGKFDYVHFVAHGVAGSQRPLDAFIQLAPGGKSYKLVARDIQNETIDARLVTIASCEGAGTRTYAGEGVVGLAWAFLHAGADQVIAALWKVDDAATGKLMDQMYAEIHSGRDPAVALRNAKLMLLRDPKRARPRFWAPFVLYAGT